MAQSLEMLNVVSVRDSIAVGAGITLQMQILAPALLIHSLCNNFLDEFEGFFDKLASRINKRQVGQSYIKRIYVIVVFNADICTQF